MRYILFSLLLSSLFLSAQEAGFDWATKFGNTELTGNSSQVCPLSGGESLVSGEFQGEATFGQQSFVSQGEKDIFLLKMSGKNVIWAKHFGGIYDDHIKDMTVDAEQNIYLILTFSTSIDIFGTIINSKGGQDGVLVKLSSGGDLLWIRQLGGASTDFLNTVLVNHNDEVLVSGKFYNSITIVDTELTSVGTGDFFIAVFAPGGDLLHIEQGGGDFTDDVLAMDVDADDNLLISGYFYGNIYLGGNEFSTEDPTGVFVAKYNNEYELQWMRMVAGPKLYNEIYVAAGYQGRVLVAGNFKGDIDFGNGHTLSTGEFDPQIYYASYSPSGNVLWAFQGGGDSSDEVSGIDSDANGNLYMRGFYLSSTIYFAPLSLDYHLCCGDAESFVAKIRSDGIAQWIKSEQGSAARLTDIYCREDGLLLTGGIFNGELVLDDITLNESNVYANYVTPLSFETSVGIKDKNNYAGDIYFAQNKLFLGFKTEGQLEIFNVLGELCARHYIPEGTTSLTLKDLKRGVYFVRYSTAGREIKSKIYIP